MPTSMIDVPGSRDVEAPVKVASAGRVEVALPLVPPPEVLVAERLVPVLAAPPPIPLAEVLVAEPLVPALAAPPPIPLPEVLVAEPLIPVLEAPPLVEVELKLDDDTPKTVALT